MRGSPKLLAAAALLAACEVVAPGNPVPNPPPRPARPVTPTPLPAPTRLSAETRAYYQHLQAGMLAQGLLRTDRGGGPDAQFDARRAVQAFDDIAFYAEYADSGDRLVPRATASRLQRWVRPVVMKLVAGPSVDPAEVARDRVRIAAYAARLGRISGHPVRATTDGAANFTVLLLTEDERRAYGTRLDALLPGLSAATRSAIIDMDPSTYCLVVAKDADRSDVYVQAVAVIRAELPDALRVSCYTEELAQGLGLANDSPRARPSIFNDDQEFAWLTKMDEVLLKMLYDPRLHPGMTREQAQPVVERIAQELLGGPR
jgi:hypothetical protein